MDKEQLIWDDEFFGPLLAAGTIPGQDNVPERLLEAMAILLSRSTGSYVSPMQCGDVAALVVLACQSREVLSFAPFVSPQSLPTATDCPHSGNRLPELQEEERLHEKS